MIPIRPDRVPVMKWYSGAKQGWNAVRSGIPTRYRW
jgi:hypothetical protein